jgi:two-component system, NtrC family, sensor histidine kinase HydH
MRFPRASVLLACQVGVVVALFAAALASLWLTGAEVLQREGRREKARLDLDRAGEALGRRAADDLAEVPEFPFTLSPDEWDALDAGLAAVAGDVLRLFPGVEGGYFVISSANRFLGRAFPTEPLPASRKKPGARGASDPPAREYYVVQSQVDAALEKNQPLFLVVDVATSSVAVRTAPVWVEGRLVGATWTMTRLADPLFLERSVRGYQRSAGLALSGIVLALGLTIGLARTVRRQAIERDRLQADLRRSERLAALGKLLAGVAHEVRNPLAGIRSTVQLWQRGLVPESETVADLEAEVHRLDTIVSRLLQFSRTEAECLTSGDLNAVVAEAARLTRPAALAQGVAVELDLEPALPAVEMAAGALMQVFRNLTANALQAMPKGGTLRLETRSISDGGFVEARITDSGPGLDPEALKHLFEPFFTTKPQGTGLGLAIAREIALAHRGELRAIAPPDGQGGAVFSLTLPIAGAAPNGEPDKGHIMKHGSVTEAKPASASA